MKPTDIAFFAWTVSDLKKARDCYAGVPGLKPNSEYDGSGNPNGVEDDIGAGTLGIGCAPGVRSLSPNGVAAALQVNNVEAALATVKAENIPVVMGPYPFPSCRTAIGSRRTKGRDRRKP